MSDGRAAVAVRTAMPRRMWLPTLVLLAGVLIFAVAVRASHAATWVGPGFSMFSTVDYTATRVVHLELTIDGVTLPAEMDTALEDAQADAALVPSEDRASALAREALEQRWSSQEGVWRVDARGQPADTAEVTVATAHVTDERVTSRVIVVARLDR